MEAYLRERHLDEITDLMNESNENAHFSIFIRYVCEPQFANIVLRRFVCMQSIRISIWVNYGLL